MAVVVVFVSVTVAVVGAVGVVAGVVCELACQMKAGQIAFLAGPNPCPCPSPAFGGIDPSLGIAPLLWRNKKQLKRIRDR